MKRETILLSLNACIFLMLLLVPRDLNGRIDPFSLESSKAVMLALAASGIIVSIVTLVYHRRRWVIPALSLAISTIYVLNFVLR
jgi:hypothetical protein